ncbi:ABC transporter substrate-binding protein [Bradyrhizobium sp.]|uniref:ABC transporter substrate-binding protein n=1 Tax=Bradyrhizobium sp. TaxID=376 RepID=UPI002D5E4CCA|nr:ABC transporter substrate-binding protein [Bradyrhizobium sp.]HZR76159.1 ABC transporter substrate-binding protein [Bradyrhizobium sp.]
MKRRDFIAGATLATMLPKIVRAQQADAVRRVAILVAEVGEDDPDYEGRIAAIREGLRGLGWIEGRNLRLDIHRSPPKATDLRKHIDALLAARPDVVVTSGGTTTVPLMQATSTVPIVFSSAVDPVGAGLVESLAHPGGNVTGFSQFDYSLSGKWLEILKQVAPSVVRAGIIRDAARTAGIGQFAVIQSVSGSLGVDVVPINATDERAVEAGIDKLARSQGSGLVVTTGAALIAHRDLIIKLAARYGLPAAYPRRTWVDRGGLISYGPDLVASAKLAAGYVDRVLKGAQPADLPVQAPTKYDLVINAKAAKQLGLTIPSTLLARADEVIE